MDSVEPLEPSGWWVNVLGLTQKPPPVLYHYCSVDAFVKIISYKQLWSTNIFFMNDSKEHFWLRDKARNYIDGQIQEHPGECGYKYLDTILKQEWMQEIYAVCFSEHGDLLSQWRSYADDGRGVAIGFSTGHLQRMCIGLNGHLCNIIYDDNTHRTLLQAAFDLPDLQGEVQTVEQGTTAILGRLSEAASRCKNPAFAEESEWRMICEPTLMPSRGNETVWTKALVPSFRSRNGTVVPYMEIPLIDGQDYVKRGMEPIKEVYFGPRTSTSLQEYATKLMLDQADFRRVRLRNSSATYR